MTVPSRELRDAGVTFFPPASGADLQRLEQRLGEPLPAEIRALYLDHDGEKESVEPTLVARLQQVDELLGTLDLLDEWFDEQAPELRREFLPLWTDDNSNFFVFFLRGAARGMIGEANHEEPFKFPPRYRNLTSLYAALLGSYKRDATDLAGDYPDEVSGEREQAVFEEHLAAYRPTLSEPLRQYHGTFLLTLCPPGREGDVLPLLLEPELAVEAGRLLTRRRCAWALEALVSAVRVQASDITVAYNLLQAITDLGAPGTDEALIALARDFPATLSASYLADALERRGFTQERVQNAEGLFVGARVALLREPGGWLNLPWE